MTELSRAARELIGKARPAELADAAAKQRVRAALAVHLAVPPVPPPPATSAATSAIAAGGGAAKAVLICSLTAAAVVGTAAVVRHRQASQRGPAPQRIAHVARPSSQPMSRPSLEVPEVREGTSFFGPARSRTAPTIAPRVRPAGRAVPPKPVPAPERAPESLPPPASQSIGRPAPVDTPLPPPAPAVQPTFAPSASVTDDQDWPTPPIHSSWGRSTELASAPSAGRPAHGVSRVTTSETKAGCSARSEIAFLARAQAALRDGQGKRALTLLDQHQALCPSAIFWEERSAARILALCLLHRERQALTEATLLAAHAPRSPQLARLRSSCAAAVIPSTPTRGGR